MSEPLTGANKADNEKTRVYTVESRCSGCGTCVTVCSRGAVTLVKGRAQVHPGRCEACGQCVSSCPRGAKKFILRVPDESEIRAALDLMGRATSRDEFDCGACGFRSCREKAVSVALGLSPANACIFAPRNEAAGSLAASFGGAGARRPGLKDVSKDKVREEEQARIVAYSAEMGKILQVAARVSRVNTTVLILGESGVGKEVIARFIYRMSDRKDGPFVKVNCGAIPETLLESELFGYETGAFTGARKTGKPGLIEMASGGVFFLDEVCELPPGLQVKLLQVLQERQVTRLGGTRPIKVDVRILAATNRDIHKMVKEGSFRSDLFYRLNVVPIVVPPLRDRKDDIIPLLYHFLDKLCRRYGMCKSVSEDVKEALVNYDWPGNVRELENLVERLVVTAEKDEITLDDLPDYLRSCSVDRTAPVVVSDVVPLKDAVEEVERQIIEKAVSRYHNTYKIAEVLGINQSTVVRKIHKYCRREANR
ncbi:MAG TPA: sigma 54-interacting transcriptional regulator [Firmicutes bacterium]|nr:sigma 54-interacting transcriptional regulator [Bacillota bacterium]